jgi:hypothetical protein
MTSHARAGTRTPGSAAVTAWFGPAPLVLYSYSVLGQPRKKG